MVWDLSQRTTLHMYKVQHATILPACYDSIFQLHPPPFFFFLPFWHCAIYMGKTVLFNLLSTNAVELATFQYFPCQKCNVAYPPFDSDRQYNPDGNHSGSFRFGKNSGHSCSSSPYIVTGQTHSWLLK